MGSSVSPSTEAAEAGLPSSMFNLGHTFDEGEPAWNCTRSTFQLNQGRFWTQNTPQTPHNAPERTPERKPNTS